MQFYTLRNGHFMDSAGLLVLCADMLVVSVYIVSVHIIYMYMYMHVLFYSHEQESRLLHHWSLLLLGSTQFAIVIVS